MTDYLRLDKPLYPAIDSLKVLEGIVDSSANLKVTFGSAILSNSSHR